MNNMQMMNQGPMGQQMGGQGQSGGWLQSLLQLLIGREGFNNQVPTMTPGQQQSSDFLRNFGQQQVQNPYAGFEPIANKLNNQWSQEVVPSLAARFSSLGSNKLTSGAFSSQLQGSNNQLQDIIGSLMSQYGQQNKQQGFGAIGAGLSPQFENQYNPSYQGLLQQLLASGGQAAGAYAGQLARGGM